MMPPNPSRRWLIHPDNQWEHWFGISRLAGRDGGVHLFTFAWGWDNDVPWSWLPTMHCDHRASQNPDGPEVVVHAHCYLSWLGFTVGHLHKSKWLLP